MKHTPSLPLFRLVSFSVTKKAGGDVVGVVNPHTEETESAFLKKQDINISNLSLANSDFIVDFTPSGAVTGYKKPSAYK